jgi:hypothetical protein
MGDYVGKKMKTSSQTLPLFRITDFSLYTETPRKDELAELIGQWREWINAE